MQTVGAMRASDVEESIQYYIGGTPYVVGLTYQIVADVQISLTGGTPNIALDIDEMPVPGSITITDM